MIADPHARVRVRRIDVKGASEAKGEEDDEERRVKGGRQRRM